MVLLSTCQSGGPRELRPLPGRKRACLHLSPLNVRVSHVWFSPERWARRRQHRAPHRLCLFRRQRRDPPAIWGASEPAAPGGRGASALPRRGARGEDGESPQSQPAPTSTSSPAVPLPPPAPRPARHLGGFRTCGPRRAGRICLAATRSQGRRRRVSAVPPRALTAHPWVSACFYVSFVFVLSCDHHVATVPCGRKCPSHAATAGRWRLPFPTAGDPKAVGPLLAGLDGRAQAGRVVGFHTRRERRPLELRTEPPPLPSFCPTCRGGTGEGGPSPMPTRPLSNGGLLLHARE